MFWKILFFFPHENVLSVLFREEFSIAPLIFLFELCFWFLLWAIKASSNYYYNLHVFFKLKVSIFLVEPEYLRSETIHNKIKQSNTFLSCCHTALFQCPGNITDNVVMASWRCLKQLSFTTELNIICENHVDL